MSLNATVSEVKQTSVGFSEKKMKYVHFSSNTSNIKVGLNPAHSMQSCLCLANSNGIKLSSLKILDLILITMIYQPTFSNSFKIPATRSAPVDLFYFVSATN